MSTVAFYTLGCKVNTYETEGVWKTFKDKGFQKVDFSDIADVYVINTCTVTNNSDSKSRKVIRKAVRQNKDAVVAVMGCYTQINSDTVLEIEGVDVVIGTKNRDQLVDFVMDVLEERKPIHVVSNILKEHNYEHLEVDEFSHNTRAFLKIQEGCTNFCSYCIIPWARGPQRSRDKEDVLNEAKLLVQNGYEEIVLAGINTATYGYDFTDYDFADLIQDISQIDGMKRIRISSIELTEINQKVLDLFEFSNVLAEQIHIPLQSGCDSVLERMNRKYTTNEYKKVISYIRSRMPKVAITTDVIVGFPGETEEEFKETYDFIKRIGFSELHVFPYSKRTGTKAAKMEGHLPNIIKTARVNKLLELNDQLAKEYALKFKGKVIEVIFESKQDDYMIGHASNYLKVKVKYDKQYFKKNVKVELIEANYPLNTGKIVEI